MSLEPVSQHRPAPRSTPCPRCAARLPGAGRRCHADYWRQRGQGPDRQDHGRAWSPGRRRRCRAAARGLAERHGARIIETGARDGHSGAVAAAARLLAREGCPGMLTVPGDIPLVTSAEITRLLAGHRPPPAFTIAPSRDERGSNAIICSPPGAVPL